MTAEIAVMNRSAIALAADSAVTIRNGGDVKVYNSVNKVFTLSKYQPVGIMVFGGATFMNVPWESVIKLFRRKIGTQKHATLKVYADQLIEFIRENPVIMTQSEEERIFRDGVQAYCRLQIVESIRKRVQQGGVKAADIPGLVSKEIEKHLVQWRGADLLPAFPKEYLEQAQAKHTALIDDAIKKAFENIPLTTDDVAKLKEIAISTSCKALFSDASSGIVVAGFGDDDIFPGVITFDIERRIDGYLKHRVNPGKTKLLGFTDGANITPFAQSSMAESFIEGVEPQQRHIVEDAINKIFASMPERIIGYLNSEQITLSEAQATKIKEATGDLSKNFVEQWKSLRWQKFISPLLNIVAALPKDELAAIAEALVSLAAFRQKVSLQAETVGGPIDVAVISKGDGFIWIKRKHYFNPDLNRHFFANYFRSLEDESGQE